MAMNEVQEIQKQRKANGYFRQLHSLTKRRRQFTNEKEQKMTKFTSARTRKTQLQPRTVKMSESNSVAYLCPMPNDLILV